MKNYCLIFIVTLSLFFTSCIKHEAELQLSLYNLSNDSIVIKFFYDNNSKVFEKKLPCNSATAIAVGDYTSTTSVNLFKQNFDRIVLIKLDTIIKTIAHDSELINNPFISDNAWIFQGTGKIDRYNSLNKIEITVYNYFYYVTDDMFIEVEKIKKE